ncbi:hypothetical protein GCM10027347_52930 [Larkinella harenae]
MNSLSSPQILPGQHYLQISRTSPAGVTAVGRVTLADAGQVLKLPGRRRIMIKPVMIKRRPTFRSVLYIEHGGYTYSIMRVQNQDMALTANLSI